MIAHGWKELTILNAETTSWNFDRRPYGFRLFEAACETDCSYSFVEVWGANRVKYVLRQGEK